MTSGRLALGIALAALGLSVTGGAEAARQALLTPTTKPRAGAVLKLDRNAKFPARAIPKVASARRADVASSARTLGGQSATDLALNCGENIDLGTWCLLNSTFEVPPEDVGKNDFFYASKTCVELGGWLPSASELVGAADRAKLSSTIDDSVSTASVDEDTTDGRKDRREMSSTLVTVQAGSSAAGSAGVSEGSTGNPTTGEPNPTPQPANPRPESTHYITVYDNANKGGLGGSKPVGQPERFRCGFNTTQGAEADAIG